MTTDNLQPTRPEGPRRGRLGLVLILAALLAFAVSACGDSDDETVESAESSEEATEATGDADEADGTDEAGDGADGEDDEGTASEAADTGDDSAAATAALDGEDIEIIVPFKEGGGTDIWARLVARYLATETGATVQVRNAAGASGIQGANEYELSTERDGLTMLVSSGSNVFPWLFGEEAVQYDFNNYVDVIASPQGAVVYVKPDLGIETVDDLCGAEGLIYGGVTPNGTDTVTLLAFELLDLDVQTILGYEGRGPARVAFEQGEVTIDQQASTAYVENVEPLIEAGEAIPLFSLGDIDDAGEVTRDPQFPDLPSFAEVYETCAGEAPSGVEYDAYKAVLSAGYGAQKNMWVHGDAPQERIDALLAGAEAVIANEDFQAEKDELLGPNEFTSGEEAKARFAAAGDIDDTTFQWLADYLATEFDVTITR